jgi:hypothetical protein
MYVRDSWAEEKPQRVSKDAMKPEKVKTGRNYYMVLDGELWV